MTIREVCLAIEAETHSRTWAAANLEMRLSVIESCIDNWTGEPSNAAKKVVKVRKPRKAKTVPLTQHAEGSE